MIILSLYIYIILYILLLYHIYVRACLIDEKLITTCECISTFIITYKTNSFAIAKMFIAIVQHVLTVFSIAVCSCCFVPMVSTIKSQDSRAIQTQSNRHRCINYNHRGCCQPLWFCTCTWTYVAQAVKQ